MRLSHPAIALSAALCAAGLAASPAAAQYGPRAGTYQGYEQTPPVPLPPPPDMVPPGMRSSASRGDLSARPPALRGDRAGWSIMVGGGALVRPAYDGSDQYEISPIPAAAITYGDWFFADPAQGIGARHDIVPGVQLAGGVSYRFGRQEDDAARLAGMGDLDGGATAFATAEARPLPGLLQALSMDLGVEAPFTGDINGAEVTADVALALPIGAGGYASFSLGAAWMTEEMMDDLFGVTPAQAAASGFAAYDPDGGLRAYRLGATAFRPVWGNWNGLISVGYDRLAGDAARSPIIETRDQYRLGAGLLYRFGG